MARFTRHKTTDLNLETIQENVADAIEPLMGNPALDGVLLTGITIAATPTVTSVSHGLGRALRGWVVVRRRANAQVWDTQDSNAALEARTLNLIASAAVVVDLYVF